MDRALKSSAPVAASLRTSYGIVDLPFVDETARARWHGQLTIDPIYLERHASAMQRLIDRDGRLPAAQRDPVQVWQFGAVAPGAPTVDW